MTDQQFARGRIVSALLGFVIGVSILAKQSYYFVHLSPVWQPLIHSQSLIIALYVGLIVLSFIAMLSHWIVLHALGRVENKKRTAIIWNFVHPVIPSAFGLFFTLLTGELLWGLTFVVCAMMSISMSFAVAVIEKRALSQKALSKAERSN